MLYCGWICNSRLCTAADHPPNYAVGQNYSFRLLFWSQAIFVLKMLFVVPLLPNTCMIFSFLDSCMFKLLGYIHNCSSLILKITQQAPQLNLLASPSCHLKPRSTIKTKNKKAVVLQKRQLVVQKNIYMGSTRWRTHRNV